ncbi:MAG TPA: hypothetical protein VGE74_19745, partial [Gemmata sp.]
LAAHGRTDIPLAEVTWGIEAQLNVEPAAFWAPLGYEFWRGLGVLEDGRALLARVEWLVGAQNVALLTSPCDTKGCVDGKRAWIDRHFSEYRRRVFFGSAKELFAGPSKVLVDDHDTNYQRFIGAGGFGVIPPRPWNMRRRECADGHWFNIDAVFAEIEGAVSAASQGAR